MSDLRIAGPERTSAEDELRRSEAFLAEGQRLSRTGSFGWNPHSGAIYWSAETHRMYQISPDITPTLELIFERVHPEDSDRLLRTIEDATRDRSDFEIEHRLLLRDGTVKHVHVVARAITDTDSGDLEYVGAVKDVTERVRAAQALRESEEQWRAVFEHNPTMYFMIDAAGTVLSVNPYGAEQLGYRVDELLGRSVLDVFHPSDREAALRYASACIERFGESLSWELRKIRKDGRMMWVRESARAMELRGRPVVLIACEDVTARERAEYLVRQIFETSPYGVSIIGLDYRYQRVNPLYERLWGIPSDRIIGMGVAELQGDDVFTSTIKPNLDRCFAGEEVSYGDWFDLPNEQRFFAVTYSPLRPDGERVEAVLAISHDVTEYMRASEALREAQSELARVTRTTMLGEITASIAHEINQPLAAVVMSGNACLRWLAADPPGLEEARHAAERVVQNGNRASEVIERIRSLLKRGESEHSEIVVNALIRETLALSRNELRQNRVTFHPELAHDLPNLVGDRVGLQQVLLNLVLNGIDAMSGMPEDRRVLMIRSRLEGDAVVIEVQDRGKGIDPELQRRMFEPFFSSKPAGLGMGLSISRTIVEAHGGRIWATRNEGPGSTLHVSLPVEIEASNETTGADRLRRR